CADQHIRWRRLPEQVEKSCALRCIADLIRNCRNAPLLDLGIGIDVLGCNRSPPAKDRDQPKPFPHVPTLYKKLDGFTNFFARRVRYRCAAWAMRIAFSMSGSCGVSFFASSSSPSPFFMSPEWQ